SGWCPITRAAAATSRTAAIRPSTTCSAPLSITTPPSPVTSRRARTRKPAPDPLVSDATVVAAAHVQHRPADPVAAPAEQVADRVGHRLRPAKAQRVALQVLGPAGFGERLPGAAGRAGRDRVD